MQKKVYLKDLSLKELIQRLNNGEKVYAEGSLKGVYYQKIDGFVVRYEYDKPTYINIQLNLDENNTPYPKYFLDEVEEPEADESCIGKLCRFWNNEGDACFGFLGEIDKSHELPFVNSFGYSGVGYKHCRPLSREEVEKFIKE